MHHKTQCDLLHILSYILVRQTHFNFFLDFSRWISWDQVIYKLNRFCKLTDIFRNAVGDLGMKFAYWNLTSGSQFGNLTEDGSVSVRYEGRYKIEAQVRFYRLLDTLLAIVDKYDVPNNQWAWLCQVLSEVSMNTIALWLNVCADDWPAEMSTIPSNVKSSNILLIFDC